MAKVRVYEVARQLGMNNRDLVALFQSLGFSEVRNHMSSVEPDVIERVKRKLERQKEPNLVEERIRPTVVKRRSRASDRRKADATASQPGASAPVASRPGASQPGASQPGASVPVASQPGASQPGASAPVPSQPAAARAATKSSAGRKSAPEPPAQASVPEPAAGEVSSEKKEPAAAEVSAEQPAPPEGVEPTASAKAEAAAEAPPATKSAASAVPEVAADEARAEKAAVAAAHAKAPAAEQAATPTTKSSAVEKMAPKPADTPVEAKKPDPPAQQRRPSQPPKTGIEVWGGRPGVPMPQRPRTGPPSARRTTYDPRANQGGGRGYGGRPVAGRSVRPGFGRGRPGGYGNRHQRRGPAQVSTKEMSAHKKRVQINGEASVQKLAGKMSLKATDVLMKLMSMGMAGVHINSTLDLDTSKLVAHEFGWAVEDVALDEDAELEAATQLEGEERGEAKARSPIVTVMGHVDHGKTSLLDRIRKASVAAGEAGGITQHIGAYRVETPRGTICFLDTPGHEAFTAMRARGAGVTDLVILVVAADDGIMPQTKEAISHSRDAKVPMIVAINKMDLEGADPERVLRDLASEGMQPEEWGGDTICVKVSAKTGEGIDQLLEMVLLQSEMLELTAYPQKRASGVVVEALLDRGRGPVARVLVQDGTLRRGDVLLAGRACGKIRAMVDETGRTLQEAGPATPVEVLGLNEVPDAGDPAHAVKDLKSAEALAAERRLRAKSSTIRADSRVSLEVLTNRLAEGEQFELKVIIKADVQGSVEAIAQALGKLSTKKVKLSIVHTGVGGFTETDVSLAVAAGGLVLGFNVRPAGKAKKFAEQEGVEIRLYSVIYEAIDEVRAAMEGLLPAKQVEKDTGKAEVRQVFNITKVGTIAGCMCIEGNISRANEVRLVRDSVVVWTGKLGSLKRFKDDAKEVREGLECGIGLEGYNDLKEGDIIEAFEIEEIKAKLEG